ncbi:hypothetical protein INT43_001826 [Umbelopsis isabellina]|uniref:Uncharacterized protein n=1 Tax=Mortierella isabellina TaxID=91625 RepID=A0A8H7PRJ6_MORIS|nr:hypothetical protein INT43_001826 [Umbelopsis isabellina]
MNVELTRASVRCIKTASVAVKPCPVSRMNNASTLRPLFQPHGSSLFVNSTNTVTQIMEEQRRTMHHSVAVCASKESESVTKDLEGQEAPKPYNEGHGSANTEEIVDSDAAFDSDTVDPKQEMEQAGDKLNVSGANEKASPTPGNDD